MDTLLYQKPLRATTNDAAPEPSADRSLADDILQGAIEIAGFLFGRTDKPALRKIYALTSEVRAALRLPVFRLGTNSLCARKSVLLRWIEAQEAACTQLVIELPVEPAIYATPPAPRVTRRRQTSLPECRPPPLRKRTAGRAGPRSPPPGA